MPIQTRTPLPEARAVLPGAPTIQAASVDEAHARVSELFCEHRLAPAGREPVRMALRSAHDADVGIQMLDYGARVRISPVSFEDFHLVQIPLRGRATLHLGRTEVHSDPRIASVPPADRPFTMTWEAGTPQLIVYVRREALAATAAAVYGAARVEGVRLAPRLDLTTARGQAFLRSVYDVHDALELGGEGAAYPRRLARETMLARLLEAVDNSAGASLSSWESPAREPGAPAPPLVRRFEELIRAHSHEDVGVLDLAEALGVPLRTLQEAVRRETGSTPSRLLCEARLLRAHALLSAGDPAVDSVTEIARRCGFGHLGRFSAGYRERFGDSPSRTLRLSP